MNEEEPDFIPEKKGIVSISGEFTRPEDSEIILEELMEQGVDLRGILHCLSGLETRMSKDSVVKYGEKMVRALIRENCAALIPVNIIPEGIPGSCKSVLLVAIGSRTYEDVEKRILQAIAHVFALCPQTTRAVIFWAAKWNGVSWMKYRTYFKNRHRTYPKDIMVVLKVFGANPILLE